MNYDLDEFRAAQNEEWDREEAQENLAGSIRGCDMKLRFGLLIGKEWRFADIEIKEGEIATEYALCTESAEDSIIRMSLSFHSEIGGYHTLCTWHNAVEENENIIELPRRQLNV